MVTAEGITDTEYARGHICFLMIPTGQELRRANGSLRDPTVAPGSGYRSHHLLPLLGNKWVTTVAAVFEEIIHILHIFFNHYVNLP